MKKKIFIQWRSIGVTWISILNMYYLIAIRLNKYDILLFFFKNYFSQAHCSKRFLFFFFCKIRVSINGEVIAKWIQNSENSHNFVFLVRIEMRTCLKRNNFRKRAITIPRTIQMLWNLMFMVFSVVIYRDLTEWANFYNFFFFAEKRKKKIPQLLSHKYWVDCDCLLNVFFSYLFSYFVASRIWPKRQKFHIRLKNDTNNQICLSQQKTTTKANRRKITIIFVIVLSLCQGAHN